MKEALSEINALRAAGIVGPWAIGGAMGAVFYLEPISTFDLYIFVIFQNSPLILSMKPIYDFLSGRGHSAEGDAVVIRGWPVQFLPAESALLREAVLQARDIDFEGVPAHVMSVEHLMAIALQTGRAKDFARLIAFVEAGCADEARLRDILDRHALTAAWEKFQKTYLK
jgi:hypothetical protein